MPVIDPKNTNPIAPENCRTCVDFKSWAKQQRKSLTTTEVTLRVNCEITETDRGNRFRKRMWKGRTTLSHHSVKTAHGIKTVWANRLGVFYTPLPLTSPTNQLSSSKGTLKVSLTSSLDSTRVNTALKTFRKSEYCDQAYFKCPIT